MRGFLRWPEAKAFRVLAVGGILAALTSTSAPAVPEDIPRQQAVAAADRANKMDAACARSACRTSSTELRLNAEDGGVFGIATEPLPYVDEGSIILYAGDAIEVELAGDGTPRFVERLDHVVVDPATADQVAGATMAFELKQLADKPDMTLTVQSALDYTVKYDAVMFVPTKEGMKSGYTSSCPVQARLGAFEKWPQPIAMIVLTHFRAVPKDQAGICK